MRKDILILCCGYPYQTDKRFGYQVAKVLEGVRLSENVESVEVGESACMIPSFIAGRKKLIVIDVFQTKDKPGTIVRLKPEEVPVTVDGLTDIPKFHLMETLDQLRLIGTLPETIFIGVVPKDIVTESLTLTPETESKISPVIDLILEEIKK
jgi:hydrogenase maturation protease